MTKTITLAATALLLALGSTACLPQHDGTLPQHRAIVDNGLEEHFAPTRLDVPNVELAECRDIGGTFQGPATSGSLGTCEGVDR